MHAAIPKVPSRGSPKRRQALAPWRTASMAKEHRRKAIQAVFDWARSSTPSPTIHADTVSQRRSNGRASRHSRKPSANIPMATGCGASPPKRGTPGNSPWS